MDLSKLNHLYRLCCDRIVPPIPVEALKEKILVILDERLDDLTNALGKVIAASALTIFLAVDWLMRCVPDLRHASLC